MVNVVVAYEHMHTMNNRISSESSFVYMKFEISKTYDIIEWKFLRVVMTKMSFNERWIELVMTCIELVSYSISLLVKSFFFYIFSQWIF